MLGDAVGHGMAPALSVTRMQAMLRMAFRLGVDLETAFRQVNDQLAATLADDRFITAFIGLLDAKTHRVRYLSGGQGPILHFQAAQRACAKHRPTGMPMGAMRMRGSHPAAAIDLAAGDILVLLSDGVFEYLGAGGALFGEERVERALRAHHRESAAMLAAALLDSLRDFAQGAPRRTTSRWYW